MKQHLGPAWDICMQTHGNKSGIDGGKKIKTRLNKDCFATRNISIPLPLSPEKAKHASNKTAKYCDQQAVYLFKRIKQEEILLPMQKTPEEIWASLECLWTNKLKLAKLDLYTGRLDRAGFLLQEIISFRDFRYLSSKCKFRFNLHCMVYNLRARIVKLFLDYRTLTILSSRHALSCARGSHNTKTNQTKSEQLDAGSTSTSTPSSLSSTFLPKRGDNVNNDDTESNNAFIKYQEKYTRLLKEYKFLASQFAILTRRLEEEKNKTTTTISSSSSSSSSSQENIEDDASNAKSILNDWPLARAIVSMGYKLQEFHAFIAMENDECCKSMLSLEKIIVDLLATKCFTTVQKEKKMLPVFAALMRIFFSKAVAAQDIQFTTTLGTFIYVKTRALYGDGDIRTHVAAYHLGLQLLKTHDRDTALPLLQFARSGFDACTAGKEETCFFPHIQTLDELFSSDLFIATDANSIPTTTTISTES